MKLTPDPTPPPPWAGVKFTCENDKCRAEYQLEAADMCELRLVLSDEVRTYNTPTCIDCGRVSVITLETPNEQIGGA